MLRARGQFSTTYLFIITRLHYHQDAKENETLIIYYISDLNVMTIYKDVKVNLNKILFR